MDVAFWTRVAFSIILSGVTVAAFTAAAERRGSRWGGLLLTLPIKVAIAMVLIGVGEGAAFAGQAARAIPAGIAANALLVASMALLLRRFRLGISLAAAFALWTGVSLTVLLTGAPGPLLGLVYWLLAAAAAIWLLQRVSAFRTVVRGARKVTGRKAHVYRGVAAGLLVGVAIVAADTLGSTLAGLVSVFPSSWLTAMYVLARDQGPDMAGATGRVMVAGSAAPAVFGTTCALLLAPLGLPLGISVALLLATAATFAGGWLMWRLDVKAAPTPAA